MCWIAKGEKSAAEVMVDVVGWVGRERGERERVG